MRKVLNKLVEPLRNNKGSILLEFLVAFILLCTCIALFVTMMPVFEVKNKAEYIAKELVRTAAVKGTTTIQQRIDVLQEESFFTFVLNWDGTEYIEGSKKVQLRNTIMVEVITEYDIGFGQFGSFPIPISAKATALSEVYHK